MKIMIASDIHGSAYYSRQVLDAFEREEADRLLLLGDILYHGPRNPLPEGYDPKATAAMLNAVRSRILCVRGNCDSEVDQMVLDFPIMADYCIIPCGEHTVFATHGHIYNTDSLPPLCPGDILIHGHTHVRVWEPFGDGNYYLNPGSVSLPKEGTRRGYIIMDDKAESQFEWKTLDGEVYHTLSIH